MANEAETQILENAPEWAEATANLARWSENYDHPTPYTLFCDLIGFNGEEFGECYFLPSLSGPYTPANEERFVVDFHTPTRIGAVHANMIDQRLGYMELGMLAEALKEYADRPSDVTAFVRSILEAGRGD